MKRAAPPGRTRWWLIGFLDSPRGWLLPIGAAAILGVVALTTDGPVRPIIAVLLALAVVRGILRLGASHRERSLAFPTGADPVRSADLASRALTVLQPGQAIAHGPGGTMSIDLWRVGAQLGLHLRVEIEPCDGGSLITVSSRDHVRQSRWFTKERQLNEHAVQEFRVEFERLVAADRPAT